MFVVFEGIDGSGKSTIIDSVQTHSKLNLVTREPGGTDIGEYLRPTLKNGVENPITELLLFQAARVEHYHKIIQPNRHRRVILCDRFIGSTYAYQGYLRNIDSGLIDALMENTLPKDYEPDITILIDVDLDTALSRIESRREERVSAEMISNLKILRNAYLELAEKHSWVIVQNNDSLESAIENVKMVIYNDD